LSDTPFHPPERSVARVAGIGYLVIIIAGIFAEFFIRLKLVVPDDAAATAANIASSEGLFRLSIASDLVMLVADAVVAVALYILLRSVSKTAALFALTFRLVHTAVYGANLFNLVMVALLIGGGVAILQVPALIAIFLKMHGYGYAIGLVFFGIHCLFLGWLVYKSGVIPKPIGLLLVVASVGYLTDSFARIIMVNYTDYEAILTSIVFIPAIVAELSLSLWLIVKGSSITIPAPDTR